MIFKCWIIALLCLPSVGSGLLQVLERKSFAQAYNFQELSIHQGLPQSQAFAILFDSRDMAWIGTQGGLCIYDGTEIRTLTKNDSLISNRIFALCEIDNEIWVGQKGGVSVLSLEGIVRRNYRFTDRSVVVQDIINYKEQLFLACNNGVWQFGAGEFSRYTDNPNFKEANCERFFRDESNELWVCSSMGLLHLTDFSKKLNKARGLSGQRVTCGVNYKNLKIIGTYDGGLNVYDPNKGFLDFPGLQELNDKIILSLFVSENEELWIGTMNSGVYVYSFSGDQPKNFRTQNGLTNNHVKVIAADYWENIWLGTSGGGISIFQNSPFVKYSTASGLNSNYVFSVLSDAHQNLWAGTEGGGVVRINDTSVVLFDEEYGFHTTKVKAIFEDGDGDIWFGTEGEGLGIYSPGVGKDTIYSIKGSRGLSANWIKCFVQDKSNQLYIGSSDGGIVKVAKGRSFPETVSFSRLKVKKGNIPSRIAALLCEDDALWFTTDQSDFGFVRNGEVHNFNREEGNFRNVVGENGTYWLGTSDNGVLQLKIQADTIAEEKWLNASGFLRSNNVFQLILKDKELWVGTEKGLDRLIIDSTLAVAKVKEHYGYEEGFEGVEANQNAAFLDNNGNLWFGTIDGLYLYQGGEVNYAQRKPPVLQMEDFQISYQSIEETEFSDYFKDGQMVKDLLLPYNKNDLQFSFRAIHYTYSKNIRYSWKLQGVDPDWSPPSRITAATYSNLSPGYYSFMVKAAIDNNWDEVEPIIISFTIDKPYWDKFWFKASYYSGIGLVILLFSLIVIFRVRRRNRVVRERLEMEKNMIELEQKALRLQMNPHFIFNVLNSIHNLIILNDPDKARYALAKFSKLMRRVLENSREKLISIDDEIETLENYVQLEKLTSNTEVELRFEIDDSIDTGEEILPPLMIQPFIENALIHGLKELDRTGIVEVGFKLLSEHMLEVYVLDNGRGRQKAAETNAQKENYHKSTALQVTQERLASMNSNPDVVPFEVIDLKDKSGNPAGTKVVFRLEI